MSETAVADQAAACLLKINEQLKVLGISYVRDGMKKYKAQVCKKYDHKTKQKPD
ncbi:hypothetical protein [Paenibacillus sp. P13VS]|uniref:hypothetical protein n=1 Tax=Paenibacillus sp. P13VS TaxID=2697367 RepID=UPI00187B4A25|nr:hypothetical protein [Paenibacillus sp. P13VS]MBE7681478.1 hypothetical protein [Paenibacillus sp. P13VS]